LNVILPETGNSPFTFSFRTFLASLGDVIHARGVGTVSVRTRSGPEGLADAQPGRELP
jgi:hypothetical protein